jgi:hypothetical protein
MNVLYFSSALLSLMLMVGCGHTNGAGAHKATPEQPLTGEAEILQTWQGDYPVAQLERLPEGQREHKVGYIADSATFGNVWSALMPAKAAAGVDFRTHLVVFVRNTQFYNRISIGKVKVSNGVAEVIAMETMSARPIRDKVAMSLAVVARKGITGIRSGDKIIPIDSQP